MVKWNVTILSLILLFSISFINIERSYGEVTPVVHNANLGIAIGQLYDNNRKDRKGRLVILNLYKDGPAYKAGLEKGDIITHIDGKATKGRSLNKVISNLLKGEEGTSVELKIYRDDPPVLINIEIEREYLPH